MLVEIEWKLLGAGLSKFALCQSHVKYRGELQLIQLCHFIRPAGPALMTRASTSVSLIVEEGIASSGIL